MTARHATTTTFLTAFSIITGLGLGFAAPASAQEPIADEEAPAAPAPAPAGGWEVGPLSFSLDVAGEHQFESELDGRGDIAVSRFYTGLSARSDLSRETSLAVGLNYSLDAYDFASPTRFGATDAWDDIHTLALSAIFTHRLNDDSRLYAGPVIQFSTEEFSQLDDGFTGGAIIGISHDFTDDLTLGVGVGVMSQIEDDVRFFPAIQVEWRLANDLRLTSGVRRGGESAGIALIWDLPDDWAFSVGGGYQFRRFRLDDDGIAPDGVGQEERLPIYARLSKTVDNVRLDLFAGLALGGELRLENNDGDRIAEADYDRTPTVGASINFAF